MKLTLLTISLCFTSSLFAQNILFIGNSLTYSNDLPGLVETIGEVYDKQISTQCICRPNYALEDHWNDGLVQKKIGAEKFDYVLFQQGPSSQANGRSSLIEYGGKISALAKMKGANPAYFMVWPSVQYYHTFGGVIKNHNDAAEVNESMIVPVGELWRDFRITPNKSDLYSADQFHPSATGSFLVALTIIKTIFPEIELSNLKYSMFKAYFDTKKDFEEILNLVNNSLSEDR